MALATRVIDFSTGSSMASSGVSLFLDEVKNVDSEGEPVSSFFPGDTIWLLATMPDTIRLVRAASTHGAVSLHGVVSRAQTDQMLFAVADEEMGLSRVPLSGASAKWYGNSGIVETVIDKSIVKALSSSVLPCLGDLSYSYKAYSLSLQTVQMVLGEDESFPYGVVIYVEVMS